MSSTTEEKLAAAIERLARSKQDQEAWDELAGCLWPLIAAINFRILRGDRELAEDASQESLLRIFRYVRFDEFRNKANDFESYARAIARNVGRRYLAQLLHEPSYLQEELEPQTNNARGADLGEERIVQRDEIATLLAGLSPEERRLVGLLEQGASLSEIAEALGISYSNAAVRVYRLRQTLSNPLKTS
jgi:RNA polymerase sigma factor (sigma-70 family)